MPVSRTAQPEHARATMVSNEIPPVPLTIEGYSVLHQMMRFRWSAWRLLRPAQKAKVIHEASSALQRWSRMRLASPGFFL